jgi:hypothetical protein
METKQNKRCQCGQLLMALGSFFIWILDSNAVMWIEVM